MACIKITGTRHRLRFRQNSAHYGNLNFGVGQGSMTVSTRRNSPITPPRTTRVLLSHMSDPLKQNPDIDPCLSQYWVGPGKTDTKY